METAKQLTDIELEKSKMLQQQKQNEVAQLKEMDELKTQSHNNISHEFRKPLSVILGMSDQKVDEKARPTHRTPSFLIQLRSSRTKSNSESVGCSDHRKCCKRYL